jgi:hypothetical protein
MTHGRRWSMSVTVNSDKFGEFEIRFFVDDSLIQSCNDFVLDRGLALGRMFPEARIGCSQVDMICYDCGFDSRTQGSGLGFACPCMYIPNL